MRVILTKTGGVMHASTAKATPIGDTTNLFMGLVRYLRKHHHLMVFGQVRGDPGVPVVQPNIAGLSEWDTVPKIRERYEEAAIKAREFAPDVCVDIAGQQCTCSWIGNPRNTGVQQRGIKYVAPSLFMMQACEVPRISLVHDPRAYPINHEMQYWDWCRPRAVLTLHETGTATFRSLKKTITAHRTYSSGGPWWSYGLEPVTGLKCQPALAIAHGHFKDGRLNRRDCRRAPWERLLVNYDGPELQIAGKDWDEFDLPDAATWLGVIKPGECVERLRSAWCGPIMPIADRFTTSKLRQYVMNDCLPLPYGRGEFLTWDHRGEFCPLDSDCRVTNADELRDAVFAAASDENWRRLRIEQMLESTTPNFEMLECAMNLELKGYEF